MNELRMKFLAKYVTKYSGKNENKFVIKRFCQETG